MSVQEKLMTIAEFDALMETLPDDGRKYELAHGELIEMPPPKPIHNLIALLVTHFMLLHVESRKLGLVIFGLGVRPFNDDMTLYFADVGYISYARLPKSDLAQYIPMAPDLAVEIISPTDMEEQIGSKVADYLRAGTQLVWVIYPKTQSAYMYQPDGKFQIIDRNGTLSGGDVLPDFTLPLADLFQTHG